MSARVEDAFLQRVRTLPEQTQTLLLVAAADEVGGASTVLRAAAQLGAGIEAFDAAEEAGLLRVDGARLEFRHPLIRSAVYHGAPLSQRQAAHRALASALDADDDRRAWHRAAATLAPDAEVVEELEQAARRARQRSGFIPASLAYERAAALATDERRRVELLTAAGETAVFGGRPDRAEMLLERALPSVADPAERAGIDFWRALIEVNVGVPAEAIELLMRSAPDMARVDVERGLYMLCVATFAAGYAGDAAVIAAVAERATEMPEADTPVAQFLAQFLRGTGAFFAEDFVAADAPLRAAVELADARPRRGLGAAARDPAAGQHRRRRARRRRRRAPAQPAAGGLLARHGRDDHAHAGAAATRVHPDRQRPVVIRGGRARGRHQARAASRASTRSSRRCNPTRPAGGAARRRGDVPRARRREHRAGARRGGSLHVGHTARWALLLLELGRGQPEAAVIHARELTGPPLVAAGNARPDRGGRACGRCRRPRAVARGRSWPGPRAAARRGRWPPPSTAARCCAPTTRPSRSSWPRSSCTRAAGRPFDRARTELAFGEYLRRARRRLEAREHLRAALDGFEALGAAAWADRARTELRASGQTARKRDAEHARRAHGAGAADRLATLRKGSATATSRRSSS